MPRRSSSIRRGRTVASVPSSTKERNLTYRDNLEATRRRADALERDNARLRRSRGHDWRPLAAIAAVVATAILLTGVTAARRAPAADCTAASWSEQAVHLEGRTRRHHPTERVSFDEGAGRCLELLFDRPLADARVDVVGYHRGRARPIWTDRRIGDDRLRIRLDPLLDSVDVEVHHHFRAEPTLLSGRIGERRSR